MALSLKDFLTITGLLFFVAVAAAAVASRRPGPPPPPTLTVTHNDSLNVTCWTSSAGGVYCLTDTQLMENRMALEVARGFKLPTR